MAAAELGRDGVARGGGVQREGEWVQRVAEVPRGGAKQEVECGLPRWRAAPATVKQRGREVEEDC